LIYIVLKIRNYNHKETKEDKEVVYTILLVECF